MNEKRVYTFGNGKAEGNAQMREVLGGKGANLAEMNLIGVPVPPGFTITTDTCNEYYEVGEEKIKELLQDEVMAAVAHTEALMNSKFGSVENPLLVSVRSGARASMPGMMDTILNLGLNDEVAEGLVKKTGNPHFVYDSYRRFVQMYGDVVMGLKPVNKEDIDPFEAIIEKVKEEQGVTLDKDLSVESLKKLVELFKAAIKEQTGQDFPTNPIEQLWGAICAVFRSWMNERAILYRKMEGIPDEWGTAVSVMAMVFGNMGDTSATGVCFSRDAGNGENLFNGEYLINAQGEDVVAGIRTPQQITKIGSQRWAERAGISEEERAAKYPSMEEAMPELYKELDALQDKLEHHYHDMQDMEFTVQEGKLWFLQTRNGKRTGTAMVKIAMDLLHEGMIDEKTAILRCEPQKLDELLHPVFDKLALSKAKVITQGLPASPGAACGQIVFHADDAQEWYEDGKKVIMVRIETSPEDLAGMSAAEGILTARGGMTSHAAVVALGAVDLHGSGEHIHVQTAVVADGHAGQGSAVLESAGLDVAHAQGDVELGQSGAAVEGTGLDVLHTVGDVHGGQGSAVLEGGSAHAGNGALHLNGGDLVGLRCPGSRSILGEVGHTAGAADGQGAVSQCPGHTLAAAIVGGSSGGSSHRRSGCGRSSGLGAAAAGQGDGGDQDRSGSAAQTDFALEFHDEVSSFLFLVYYFL